MYLMRYLLRENGYEVLEAKSGEEGFILATSENPDLILMDIQLPGIDGLDAVTQIRESSRIPTIPIIAVTSYAMTGDRERAIAAGCNGYIEKPIDPESFIREIKSILHE